MKTLNHTLDDLLLTYLQDNKAITYSSFRNLVYEIIKDYTKHNIKVNLIDNSYADNVFFNEYAPKKYKNYLHIKFNSSDPILIKKKDIDLLYNRVYYTYKEYRAAKIKKILNDD